MFYVVDAATCHAFVFPLTEFLKFRTTLTFCRYGSDLFKFWRKVDGAIPTLVVVVDDGRTFRTYDDLRCLWQVAIPYQLSFFARAQQYI